MDFLGISLITLLSSFQGKQLFTTILGDCVSSPSDTDVDAVAPCTHEEADTRIFLHVNAATLAGHRRVIVRSSDSDVVVLGISTFVALGQRIDELWIAFGSRRHFRYSHFSQISLCQVSFLINFFSPSNAFLFSLL